MCLVVIQLTETMRVKGTKLSLIGNRSMIYPKRMIRSLVVAQILFHTDKKGLEVL